MYKHILLPYDGSQLSEKALSEGIVLAKDVGSKLTLLYVMAPYHLSVAGDHTSSAVKQIERQHLEELEKVASAMLATAQQRAAAGGIKCESIIRTGPYPHEEILAAAKQLSCDLILMASHGRSGLQSILLGSETTKVLTHSVIPVLVVR
jgi:nucleotide-binding universal stress UspA family protein